VKYLTSNPVKKISKIVSLVQKLDRGHKYSDVMDIIADALMVRVMSGRSLLKIYSRK
jgi:hypothetical protein